MFRLSAKWKITIGLVLVLIGVALSGIGLEIIPDWNEATLRGRLKLCESLAISGSLLVQQSRVKTLETILQSAVDHLHEHPSGDPCDLGRHPAA